MDSQNARLYVENVAKILYVLSSYKSKQASFIYRHKKRRYLVRVPGYQAAIESMLLRCVLERLGVPFTVEPRAKMTTAGRKITVTNVEALRKVLDNMDARRLKKIIAEELEILLDSLIAHFDGDIAS
ncbi:hypothetical protein [Thermofilum sp.]|jgi:hypothetical protein|uniref:hypothetical protein n=1 Tax=Thermofilum sp. TaxID=1961369 RepID=UPI00258C0B2C|nr:hypothetical protein [Thermofilum sp.]